MRTRALGWDWTIVAVCAPDPARERYFRDYCASLGAIARPLKFHDYPTGKLFSENRETDVLGALTQATTGCGYDWIFTHSRGPHGEYGGHTNHDEVRLATTSLVREGVLGKGEKQLAYFSYQPIYGLAGRATVAAHNVQATQYDLQLTYAELAYKCHWCAAAPDAQSNLKNLGYPCPNPECVEGDDIQLPEPPFVRRG